jgi:uncharacterized protein YdeI (YjbR/CyaY-like superfamily)
VSERTRGEDLKGERVAVETVEQWADWLEANHARQEGVWVVSWSKSTGKPSVGYEAMVCEALRFGWIDSKGIRLDEERAMQWFSPRRPGSGWARTNKVRIERLEREGRMAPAGRKAIESAKADGSWQLLDAVEDLTVPDDLAAAFIANPGSADHWEAFPQSVKRAILEWIVQAKRPETRARRVTETATLAAQGVRANQPKPTSNRR